MNQYPEYPPEDMEYLIPEKKRNILPYVLIAMIFIVVLVASILLIRKFPGDEPTIVCGNGICEPGERNICLGDCPEHTVTTLSCGNNVCDPGENTNNCCIDCPCGTNQICNTETKQCEYVEADISDAKVEELIRSYFSNQGKPVNSVRITGSTIYEGITGKVVVVEISGESVYVIVTINEDIVEFERL